MYFMPTKNYNKYHCIISQQVLLTLRCPLLLLVSMSYNCKFCTIKHAHLNITYGTFCGTISCHRIFCLRMTASKPCYSYQLDQNNMFAINFTNMNVTNYQETSSTESCSLATMLKKKLKSKKMQPLDICKTLFFSLQGMNLKWTKHFRNIDLPTTNKCCLHKIPCLCP